ncbi:MAG: FeoB-associated Cys-rich membrane protein [Muribaculaceae bacterium]|nr:FeoB-associated Cys-rich membrane protein [Muribaculaceae bacterium]
MNETVQWIIVGLILLSALVFIIYRIMQRRKNDSDCNSCSDCPLTDNCSKRPAK